MRLHPRRPRVLWRASAGRVRKEEVAMGGQCRLPIRPATAARYPQTIAVAKNHDASFPRNARHPRRNHLGEARAGVLGEICLMDRREQAASAGLRRLARRREAGRLRSRSRCHSSRQRRNSQVAAAETDGNHPQHRRQVSEVHQPEQSFLSAAGIHQTRRHQLLRRRRSATRAALEGPAALTEALSQWHRRQVFFSERSGREIC